MLLQVLASLLLVVAVLGEDPYLLVGRREGIDRLSLDGTENRTIITHGSSYTYSLAYDYSNGLLFYTTSGWEIRRCTLTGEEDQWVVRGIYSAGLALDLVQERLYMTDWFGGRIQVCDYAGQNRQTLVTGLDYPEGLALDTESRMMYWTEYFGRRVMSASMDGSDITTLHQVTGGYPRAVALDQTRGLLYWSDWLADQLHVLDLQTGADSVILSGYNIYGLTLFHDHLYFTDYSKGTVHRCGLSGEDVRTIAGNIGYPCAILVVTDDQTVRTIPHVDVRRVRGEEPRFRCRMPSVNLTDSFLVDWLSGDSALVSDLAVSAQETTLRLADLDAAKVKDNLWCRTRLVTSVNGTEQVGELKGSNVLKAEVKVRGKVISLIEGQATDTVDVSLSLPPIFFNTDSINLGLLLEKQDSELRDHEKQVIDQVVVKAAEGSSTSSQLTITDTNWSEDHKFVIKALQDGKTDGTQRRTLRVNMAKIKNGAVTEQIDVRKQEVSVSDRDSRSACRSWNDPRLTTFDGRYFSNHYEGEFVFYKHNYYKYQVNVMQARCRPGSTGTCNCAVAVRADDDVLVLDKCSRSQPGDWRKSKLNIYILKDGNLSSGVSIWSLDDGRQHAVEFPHGGTLTVGDNSFGALQVTYKPVPEDYQQTAGLCGTYDLDSSNDFTMRDGTQLARGDDINEFNGDWRAGKDEHMFAGVELSNDSELPAVFCSVLEGRGERCAPGLDKKITVKTATTDNESILRKRGKDITEELAARSKYSPRPGFDMILTNTRRRRSTSPVTTQFDPFAPFAVDESSQPQATVWPTPSGLTEQQARDFCSQTLQFSTVQSCASMTSENFQQLVDDCVDDIGLTDDLSWQNDTVSTIYDSCLTFLDSLDNSAPDGGEPPAPPGGVQRYQILDNVCDKNCSGHGNCTDGMCNCDEGFTGYDCSLGFTEPPELAYLLDTFCDINTGPCDEVVVFGDKFQDRSTLQCHIDEYTLGSPVPQTASFPVMASFLRFDQVLCPVQKQTAYVIRVSNDGVHVSAERRLFVVYNSSCQECLMSGQNITTAACQLKASICLIDGACYMNEASNPNNECEICDPASTSSSWTRSQGQQCVDVDPGANLMLILAVCGAVALVILIGAGCIIFAIKRSRSSPPTHSGAATMAMSDISRSTPRLIYWLKNKYDERIE